MNPIVEEAIARLRQLPADRQEHFAGLLLNEIEEDDCWLSSTASHHKKLSDLTVKILEADRRGECEPLDPETL